MEDGVAPEANRAELADFHGGFGWCSGFCGMSFHLALSREIVPGVLNENFRREGGGDVTCFAGRDGWRASIVARRMRELLLTCEIGRSPSRINPTARLKSRETLL